MVKNHLASAVNAALPEAPRSIAAAHVKAVALRLFAERGIDGVTVREIASAADHRNHAVVGYYFGSKEQLVREIVVDGAVEIDARRHAALDALEARGGPHTLREIATALICAAVAVEPGDDWYTRFVVMLSMTHRELMMDALENRWNAGYRRCLDHARRLMPPMPHTVQNQRLAFMGAYLGAVLAARQHALAHQGAVPSSWGAAGTLDHFADSLAAVLAAPHHGASYPAAPKPDPHDGRNNRTTGSGNAHGLA